MIVREMKGEMVVNERLTFDNVLPITTNVPHDMVKDLGRKKDEYGVDEFLGERGYAVWAAAVVLFFVWHHLD